MKASYTFTGKIMTQQVRRLEINGHLWASQGFFPEGEQ